MPHPRYLTLARGVLPADLNPGRRRAGRIDSPHGDVVEHADGEVCQRDRFASAAKNLERSSHTDLDSASDFRQVYGIARRHIGEVVEWCKHDGSLAR